MTLNYLKESIEDLINTPNMRPFLFRTRFERNMIRILKYAQETNRKELYNLAEEALGKMREIVDKSNTTVDGELRSHSLLENDMKAILNIL